MASKQSTGIPEQAFTALGFTIPALARLIDRECGITLGGWLVLTEVKRRGKHSPHGPLLLRYELTRLFDERGFTRPNVTKILNMLFEKNLITRPRLTADERKNLFGSSDGSRLAVVLTPEGERKIEEFKSVLRSKFVSWQLEQPRIVRAALKVFNVAAIKLLEALAERPANR